MKPLGNTKSSVTFRSRDPKLSDLVQGRPSDLALASVAFSVFRPFLGHQRTALKRAVPVSSTLRRWWRFCARTIAEVERLTLRNASPAWLRGRSAFPQCSQCADRGADCFLRVRSTVSSENEGGPSCCGRTSGGLSSCRPAALSAWTRAGEITCRRWMAHGRKFFARFSAILDPCGCMAPSRYEPLWRKDSATDIA